MALLDRFRQGLKKTSDSLTNRIAGLFSGARKLDSQALEELEEALISCDLGVETSEQLLQAVSQRFRDDGSDPWKLLRNEMLSLMGSSLPSNPLRTSVKPWVILLVGVNGSGKTTTAAKMAHRFRKEGKSVMVAACDTFRAAAIEQLQVWAERVGAVLVKQQPGSDAASVAFDALSAARARDIDILLIDTAGRLHTKANLMKELEKISRVLKKQMPDAPHEVLLVLDATTGQNALVQAREFHRTSPVTGLILTKLDGTSKGGIVLAIHREHGIPVEFVGIGEQADDLEPFQIEPFVDALLAH
jgi:fused signal recognition particle receptor